MNNPPYGLPNKKSYGVSDKNIPEAVAPTKASVMEYTADANVFAHGHSMHMTQVAEGGSTYLILPLKRDYKAQKVNVALTAEPSGMLGLGVVLLSKNNEDADWVENGTVNLGYYEDGKILQATMSPNKYYDMYKLQICDQETTISVAEGSAVRVAQYRPDATDASQYATLYELSMSDNIGALLGAREAPEGILQSARYTVSIPILLKHRGTEGWQQFEYSVYRNNTEYAGTYWNGVNYGRSHNYFAMCPYYNDSGKCLPLPNISGGGNEYPYTDAPNLEAIVYGQFTNLWFAAAPTKYWSLIQNYQPLSDAGTDYGVTSDSIKYGSLEPCVFPFKTEGRVKVGQYTGSGGNGNQINIGFEPLVFIVAEYYDVSQEDAMADIFIAPMRRYHDYKAMHNTNFMYATRDDVSLTLNTTAFPNVSGRTYHYIAWG